MMKNKVELLVKSIPLILAYLMGVGYIKLQVYYQFFNIQILDYFSLSELPTLVFDGSLYLVITTIFLILFFADTIFDIGRRTEDLSQNELNEFFKGRKKWRNFYDVWFLGLFLFWNGKVIYKGEYILLLYSGLVVLIFLCIKYTFNIIAKSKDKFIKSNQGILLALSLICIVFFALNGIVTSYILGHDVKNENKINQNISFIYHKNRIETNSTFIYIGRTQSTLFLYDKKTEETVVLRNEFIDNYIIESGKE